MTTGLGIEIDELTLRYGGTVALDGLTVRLDPGKIYGLVGRNGSGKTSLLSVLAAFRRPTGGTARVDGEEPFENERLTRQICLIREGGDLFETEKVHTVLSMARALRPYWDDEYADRLVDRFELPRRRPPGQLSRGQRSALACVLGLASRAPLTIFDESYLGMDPTSRYAFYEELLSDYVAHPRTVILSTHLVEEFGALFEEVVLIDRGRLLLHDDVDAVRARGVSVTGPTAQVEAVTAGLTVLNQRRLGPTSSATIYGHLDDERRQRAEREGLTLEPVPLQDLIVHLTREQPAPHRGAAT